MRGAWVMSPATLRSWCSPTRYGPAGIIGVIRTSASSKIAPKARICPASA